MINEFVLFILGLTAGFFSGLLGIGGAVLLIPMLMFIPPLFGFEFSFHHITGLSMAFVFFASFTGALLHFKAGNLKRDLIVFIGGSMLIFAFLGATISKYLPEKTLTGIFALVMALSIVMLIRSQFSQSCAPNDNPKCNNILASKKDKVAGAVLGSLSGMFSGLVGVGGAAIIIPSLTYILKIPIKTCIGSSLGIVLAGSITGFFGKAITGQVPFLPAVFIVIGGIFGSRFGSKLSFKLSGDQLKKILIIFLVVVLIRILFSL